MRLACRAPAGQVCASAHISQAGLPSYFCQCLHQHWQWQPCRPLCSFQTPSLGLNLTPERVTRLTLKQLSPPSPQSWHRSLSPASYPECLFLGHHDWAGIPGAALAALPSPGCCPAPMAPYPPSCPVWAGPGPAVLIPPGQAPQQVEPSILF